MATHKVTGDMLRQMHNAADLMARYIEYAKRIGCTVEGDSISCTEHQSKLLTKWWKDNTK